MRTFSEAEARDVFARAARDQQAAAEASASGEGLTLDELQEIGLASGLDPAFVAAAAAAGVGAPERRAQTPTRFGVPVDIWRSRILAVRLSDEAWEKAVKELRAQFGGPGMAGQVGRTREWVGRSSASSGLRVAVTARPLPDGQTEITIAPRAWREQASAFIFIAALFSALLIAGLALSFISGTSADELAVIVGVFGTLALGSGLGATLGMRAWARRLDARFESALDRIELVARAEAPPARLGETAPAPRLELDALGLGDVPEEGDAPETTAPRRRTRP